MITNNVLSKDTILYCVFNQSLIRMLDIKLMLSQSASKSMSKKLRSKKENKGTVKNVFN